jgi:hypothetical protein
VLAVLATLFAGWEIAGTSTGSACREDESWAYVWIAFTPIVAAAAVLVMVVVANRSVGWARWRGRFTTGRLLAFALLVAWVAVYLVVVALEGACVVSNVPYGAATLILPTAIGIATVLVPMWWRLRRVGELGGGPR